MNTNSNGIAIIGMSGRFPGAGNLDEFWRNLVSGVESISLFSDEELAASGLNVAELRRDPNYVTARGIVNEAEWFDASFFNISAREAEAIDPQQRLFLEAAWEVLENAGYDSARVSGYVGVYAGMSASTYNLGLGEKNYLATRVAYKLNLRGPALNVYTGCSTSLVAVCQACQSLLSYQCDLALAGGVSVTFPQKRAYYQEGGMLSPDGHCRPFDAKAAGTNFSDGLGVVALKRLGEALNDGDQIYAVIKGFGLNNDGSAKVGFAAPSVTGQAEVIALALGLAGVEPASVSYVETHGTATPLGDPIEIAALTQAFRAGTSRKNFCAIGSVKGNIGHLDAAAGVASLLKTALALKHKVLPPSVNFTEPNPKIDFANSPFFVNSNMTDWKAGPTPRRAGVSGFGVGGTNAHVVLEEAPPLEPSSPARPWQLLLLSAKTSSALDAATTHLGEHLKAHPGLNLADAAFTLQVGRRAFDHRRLLVCRDVGDAIQVLEGGDPKRIFTQQGKIRERQVVFMFPGQGAQYVNMGAELYRTEQVFKEEVDRCSELLCPSLGLDLRQVLFPVAEKVKAAEELLIQTRNTQPALFVIEYAMARLWMSWGVKPCAMIGHSVGEYVAACLAGVFTLEEALRVVAGRAQLVQAQPGGAMLAVRMTETEVAPLLTDALSIAAINSPSLCVVSGPFDAVANLEERLKKQGVAARRLQTSHAFHSAMMEPVLGPLTELLENVNFHKPSIPYVSNVTGRWITESEATNPKYWASHVRQTVRFADGVGELLKDSENILLEVGPGQTLGPFAIQHPARTGSQVVVSSAAVSRDHEAATLLTALGKLWLAGASVDWSGFYKYEKRRRVTLPGYPFERKRFWMGPASPVVVQPVSDDAGAQTDKGLGPVSLDSTVSRKKRILAMLTTMFQELSSADLSDVGPSASFMEMGLDSLFLGQASQTIEKRFGIKIAFRQLLQEMTTLNDVADFLDQKLPPDALAAVVPPTPIASVEVSAPLPGQSTLDAIQAQLQALTRQVELLRQALPSSGIPPTAPVAEQAEMVTLPLSESQMELWLASRASEDASRAFNQVFAIRLTGRSNEAALQNMLQQLVDRHDALRTTFAPDGSGQRIFPTWKIDLRSRDLSALNDSERERALAEAMAQEDQTPFDLEHGPLFRCQVLKMGEGRCDLILAAHHIILDGWSIRVLLREFSQLYDACETGTVARLDSALQFRDYVEWQKAPENRAAFAAAEAYWLERVSGLQNDIELPADRPRPPVKTYRAAEEQLVLDSSCSSLLKQSATAHDCTLFVYLLASLKAWLNRVTGEDDLVVGIAAAGQLAMAGHPGSKLLVGHFVNALALRSQCDGNAPFSDHLRNIKGVMLDALEHQNFTLGSLVKKMRLRTDASRLPLIPIVFNLVRGSRQMRLRNASVVYPPKAFGFFDLNIEAVDSGQDIRIVCRYNPDLFDATTIGRWLGQWKMILDGVLANPGQRISDLRILGESEFRQIVAWNRTETEYPRDACIHQLVEAQAKQRPNAAAVMFEGEVLSYSELDQRANQLARRLMKMGVGPDVAVGVCMERSPQLIVGLLGILKAGGAYLPLDPAYPKERLSFMVADAGLKIILSQQSLSAGLPAADAQVVCLDSEWDSISQEKADHVVSAVKPENLAYVIYTSGSTGRPKGVLLEHRGLCNLVKAEAECLQIHPGSRVLQFASISFDASVWEIFGALAAGATLCMAKFEKLLPGPELLTLLREQSVSVVTFPPGVLAALSEEGLPALQTIVSAGEACTLELARRWGRGRRFINGYGPTEATVCASMEVIGPDETKLTIGRPNANCQIHILDARLAAVPVGVPGELYLGGVGLARGYCNRPELTRDKFVANPFSSTPGARLYRTGDLGRYLPDGRIEYLGRMDHQVKVRGFRIELGEIESALAGHSGVREAVVAVREDVPGDKRLVAYVTAKDGAAPTDSELRDLLRAKLPEFMVPSAFVILERFPVTPNGKVDRKALPAPQESGPSLVGPSLLPRNEMEHAIAAIWLEVLHLEKVGVEDSFFRLGGHSLLLVQVQNRLEKVLNKSLSMMDLFRYPTISSLAAHLSQKEKADAPLVESKKLEQKAQEGRNRLKARLTARKP